MLYFGVIAAVRADGSGHTSGHSHPVSFVSGPRYGGKTTEGDGFFDRRPSPEFTGLAHEGVKLTDFYANHADCSPTCAALITGRYQQRYGIESPLRYDDPRQLPAPQHAYSCRSATSGCIRAARRAGTNAAATPTSPVTEAMASSATGSMSGR